MIASNPELLQLLLEGISVSTRGNAEMLDRLAKIEEALGRVSLTFANLQESGLVPKLIGPSRPDLVGRYVLSSIRLAELQSRARDVTKLTIEQKKELAKDMRALADEIDSISKAVAG